VISGLAKGDASSPSFKVAVRGSAASLTKLSIDQISVDRTIEVTTARLNLAATGASIIYFITAPNGNVTMLTALLNSGGMSSLLKASGYPTADAGIATILDLSPSSTPTSRPSVSTPVRADANRSGSKTGTKSLPIGAVVGGIVGSIAFIGILSSVACFIYRKKIKAASSTPPSEEIVYEEKYAPDDPDKSIFVMDSREYLQ
jgi:hypothetical protein